MLAPLVRSNLATPSFHSRWSSRDSANACGVDVGMVVEESGSPFFRSVHCCPEEMLCRALLLFWTIVSGTAAVTVGFDKIINTLGI